jgi:hypothetical protein
MIVKGIARLKDDDDSGGLSMIGKGKRSSWSYEHKGTSVPLAAVVVYIFIRGRRVFVMASISSKWGPCITTTSELLEAILISLDDEKNLSSDKNDTTSAKRPKWTSSSTTPVSSTDLVETTAKSPPFVGRVDINDSSASLLSFADFSHLSQYRYFLTKLRTQISLQDFTKTQMRICGSYQSPGIVHPQLPLQIVITADSEELLASAILAVQFASETGRIPSDQVRLPSLSLFIPHSVSLWLHCLVPFPVVPSVLSTDKRFRH